MSNRIDIVSGSRIGERRVFGLLAAGVALLVFGGFARTFYLYALFHVRAPSTFLAVHGTLMSAWILLLVVQTALISAHRVIWHRRLGIVGAMLAAVIVPIGCIATVNLAIAEVRISNKTRGRTSDECIRRRHPHAALRRTPLASVRFVVDSRTMASMGRS